MKTPLLACLLSLCAVTAVPALAQTISPGTCAPANLSGPYSFVLNGRIFLTTGGLGGVFDSVGIATFDGVSGVTFQGTDNTLTAAGQSFTYSGTYTLASNCLGSITFTKGSAATLALVVWSSGAQFDISGTDPATGTTPALVYGGNGSDVSPPACATASVSGGYTYLVQGWVLSGTAPTDAANESGVFQFDGQGNVSANTTLNTSQSAAAAITAMGTYTVGSNCLGSITMMDTAGKSKTINFAVAGAHGENLKLLESSGILIASGSAHSAFDNPSQSIANVANYAYSATPPGSVFALFGLNLANKEGSAMSVPLPDTIQGASVTVNGEPAPLFYADTMQIDAQMPWDIQGNTVATVIVKNGTTPSNAAAVYVPAAATPGISFYSTNRAVVVNLDGNLNSPTDTASVGDEEVMYFTGGGPVIGSGKLVTGSLPPGAYPVTDPNASITVGGVPAKVDFVGLSPTGIGLYQANFNVPQLAKGSYPVVLTISGTASNTLLGSQDPNPVINVGN